jgi:ribose/xylose/arabinose/galactoside ABC-type transport system permease subunit
MSAFPERGRLLDWMERYALVAALIVTMVAFALLPATQSTFLTTANLKFVLNNQALPVLVALAVMVPLVCHEFDLSVGSVAALSSVVTAAGITRFGLPWSVAVLIAIAISATIGLCTGVLVARAGINSLVATLGVSSIIVGVLTWYTKGQSVLGGFPRAFLRIGEWPTPLVVFVVIAAVLWYAMEQTPFGRRIYAVGSNREAARLVGVGVQRTVITTFMLSGTLAGAAGVVSVARNSAGSVSVGPALVLPALAAAFLGATAFRRGFNVLGTVVGVLLVAFTVSGFTLAGIDPWVKDVINGTMLLVAVAAAAALRRHTGNARGDTLM